MKTEALEAGARQVRVRRGLRRRPPRRGEEPRQGAHLLVPLARPRLGSAQPAAGAVEPVQHPHPAGRDRSASSRCRTGPSSTSGTTSCCENIPVVPLYFAKERPVVQRSGTWIMVDDDRLPLEPGEKPQMRLRPLPHARLLSADRRDRVRRRLRSRTSSPRCRPRGSRNGRAA